MTDKYYDLWQTRQILSTLDANPFEAKNEFEKYLKKYPNDYEAWWGIKDLPSVNQDSTFVDFITGPNGVLDKWMKFGIKGVRLDVVDELNTSFVQKINYRIKENDKEKILVKE